jgi:hypothetical protein
MNQGIRWATYSRWYKASMDLHNLSYMDRSGHRYHGEKGGYHIHISYIYIYDIYIYDIYIYKYDIYIDDIYI